MTGKELYDGFEDADLVSVFEDSLFSKIPYEMNFVKFFRFPKAKNSYMVYNTLCVIYTCTFEYITWSSKEDYSTDYFTDTTPLEIEDKDEIIDYVHLANLITEYVQNRKSELENEKVEIDY